MTYHELLKTYRLEAEKIGKEKEAIDFLVLNNNNLTKSELIFKYFEQVENEDVLLGLFKNYLYNDIPVQYLIGYTYFYGLKIFVNEHVLIPRQDSEILIDSVLANLDLSKEYNILDIGTGSGALAIALKKHLIYSKVDAVDISLDALEIANSNGLFNKVSINFFESNIFSNVEGNYDVIISNPPYISIDEELSNEVRKEPHLALYSKNKGLYFYEEILRNIKKHLKSNFLIIFEIGSTQAKEIKNLAKKYLDLKADIVKDLQGLDRVVIIKEDRI
ncbi:MAG TPA: peptide chain release factor N(5)-glutamine methyltransferase [Acholeplasmataceae bacterium]|nr:peptide chain release factor N(5)-glutamine methyltransferase [Acholeplasmataceae bacterium]